MVRSLQRLALSIPDLQAGAEFYTTFGMKMREGNDMLAFRCENQDHDEIVLIETGQSRKFHHISFATDAAGIKGLRSRLADRDVLLLDPPYEGEGHEEGVWFRDPEGNLVNVHIGPSVSVESETPPVINTPGNIGRLNERGCPPFDINPRPRRLGHMILFTPDVPAQAKFYTDVVGMKLSDWIADGYAAFLRTAGDSDHHVLAFLNSPSPGFHHASFEMGSIDETEIAAKRLVGKGFKHAWGPGRHGVGSNYFHYFRDPWNGMVEYFFDIDYLTEDSDWEPTEWTKQSGMFLWSADGPPPPDFGTNYEAE